MIDEDEELVNQEDCDRDADYYDSWREDCSIEFQEDLEKLVKSYLCRKNHYMNSQDHVISGLRACADSLVMELEDAKKEMLKVD
jgi:hypothetical protein